MDSVQPGHFFQRQAKQATRKARISDWKQQTQQEQETNPSKIMKSSRDSFKYTQKEKANAPAEGVKRDCGQ
jgi:uncharacterized short protein YbdD (DUF466 family)